MELEITLVISQIFAFLIVFWLMKKFAWKPFCNILETRRKKIEETFQSLEAQKKSLEELHSHYQEQINSIEERAKQELQEARLRGQALAQELQEEAQTQARIILEKAREEISQEIKRARGELKGYAVNLVVQTTEKLMQEKLDLSKDQQHIEHLLDYVELKQQI
jgi:F-type H+-transporting ATPase subunit b